MEYAASCPISSLASIYLRFTRAWHEAGDVATSLWPDQDLCLTPDLDSIQEALSEALAERFRAAFVRRPDVEESDLTFVDPLTGEYLKFSLESLCRCGAMGSEICPDDVEYPGSEDGDEEEESLDPIGGERSWSD